MTELQSLLRLQTWLSPAFPTGAFSYSHGLEAAINNGAVSHPEELKAWLSDLLTSGPGWNDAVVLAESWRRSSSGENLEKIADLAIAMSISSSRRLETTAQGEAFVIASRAWCDVGLSGECPLPVAVGAVAGRLDIDLPETLTAFLHAYISNQIQAALRLMKLGQEGVVELLAELEASIIETVRKTAISSLDDVGSNTVMADIVAMQHETMNSRIFRS